MSSDFFHRSFSLDISILNSLQSLLLKAQVASDFTLDQAQCLLLEQPFPLKPITCLDNFNLYSNEELTSVIKQNMKDYHDLLEIFGKVNEERKLLRKNNIALLQKLFCMELGGIGESDRDFQHFLNKIVFLNNDFMKKHILKLERQIQTKDEELNKKSSDMLELKQQMQRLERKLQSSRESFKNYLVNGKTDEPPTTVPPAINQNLSNNHVQPPNFPSITSIHISDDESSSHADILDASKKKDETIKNLKKPLTTTKVKPLTSDITKSKKGLIPESKKLQFDSKPKTPSARVSIDFGAKKPLALNLKEKAVKVLPTNRTARSFTMITPTTSEIKNSKKSGVGLGGKKEETGGKKEDGVEKKEEGGKKVEGGKKDVGGKKDEVGGKNAAAPNKGIARKK